MAYLFDPETLHTICEKALGLPREEMFDQIAAELDAEHPGHVELGPRKWRLANTGGRIGEIALLHASLTEYVALSAAPVTTTGHSGRHLTHRWDFLLSGRMQMYEEGDLDARAYAAGDFVAVPRGQARGVEIEAGTSFLEYARGPIPTMVAFGLFDSIFSTADFRAVARITGDFRRLAMRELRRGKI